MARPWRIRYAGAKYHVTSRGNGRQRIFFGAEDYARFLCQLRSALDLDEVILYAYACMPNHTHLLVETPLGNIQKFMQRLNTAYSMYFRYKHSRPGHCLQGRYGAKLVSGDAYLLRLTRYIHLNPVETKAMRRKSIPEKRQHLREFRWSSYRGYVDRECAEDMVDYRWLDLTGRRTMKGKRRAYQRYIDGMMGKEDDILKTAMCASSCAIGDDAFREEVSQELKEARLRKGSFGRDVTWPAVRPKTSLKEIEQLIMAEFDVDAEDLRAHGRRAGIAKKVALELCCEFTTDSQRQIGVHFGYTSNGAVGKQRLRLRELLAEDKALLRRIEKIRTRLTIR